MGKYIKSDPRQEEKCIYTYAAICVELDVSKGLSDKIIIDYEDVKWINLDWVGNKMKKTNNMKKETQR